MELLTAAQIVFWVSAAALFYAYAGYPLLVWVVAGLSRRPVHRQAIEPKVTVLITAYNEEASIERKIINTLELEYPSGKLEILVASDGSTDRTDEIVRGFESRGVRLFHQAGRVGKTATQNAAVELATGEIVVFSDATTEYPKDMVRALLPSFADDGVGCVAGRLLYTDDSGSDIGKGAKGYWNYETFIKRNESAACSLIGASGCLYAVRRAAYRPMYPEACSDFLICTVLYEQGLRSVFEPEAVCFEETNRASDKEFRMRVRVISQTFTDLWRNRRMMNPLKSGFYAVQLLSHKVLRYSVPLFLATALVSAVALATNSGFFAVFAAAQCLFYLSALVAWLLERSGVRTGPLAIPLYFVLANIASAMGFYKFLRGERYASWEPIREGSEEKGDRLAGLKTT